MKAAFSDKADSINQLDVVPKKMQRVRVTHRSMKDKLKIAIGLPPTTDLFGQETTHKRTNDRPEAARPDHFTTNPKAKL